MEKAVTVAKEDLATVRTGRASPQMFAKLTVDYYGTPTPIPQMATINVPEPRMAVIKPYDANQLKAIEKAIRNIRRHAKDALDRLARDGEAGEDDVHRAEKELEDTTGRYVHTVDELVKHKEAELLEV